MACFIGALSACSLITDGEDRYARVEVDPVVRQAMEIAATGEIIENETVQDHGEIACATTTPPQCYVGEYINVSVFNGSPRRVFYRPTRCYTPIQRLGANGWRPVFLPNACPAAGIGPAVIGPAEAETIMVILPRPPAYDWRTADYELRVELDLTDKDGALALERRVSEPFRLIRP